MRTWGLRQIILLFAIERAERVRSVSRPSPTHPITHVNIKSPAPCT